MILPLIALAFQAASPQAAPPQDPATAAMLDPEFGAADDAWMTCRDRQMSLAVASGRRSDRDVVAAAFAGCAAEEARLRAVLVARLGEAEGGRTMERIRGFSRSMMLSRLRAMRR